MSFFAHLIIGDLAQKYDFLAVFIFQTEMSWSRIKYHGYNWPKTAYIFVPFLSEVRSRRLLNLSRWILCNPAICGSLWIPFYFSYSFQAAILKALKILILYCKVILLIYNGIDKHKSQRLNNHASLNYIKGVILIFTQPLLCISGSNLDDFKLQHE